MPIGSQQQELTLFRKRLNDGKITSSTKMWVYVEPLTSKFKQSPTVEICEMMKLDDDADYDENFKIYQENQEN